MFTKDSSGLLVFCDREAELLHIAIENPFDSNSEDTLLEIATFSNEREYLTSKHSLMIRDEFLIDRIFWLWAEIEREIF